MVREYYVKLYGGNREKKNKVFDYRLVGIDNVKEIRKYSVDNSVM